MYVSLSSVQGIAAIVYMVVGFIAMLIAYDFFLSKDGTLRKILILVFSSWAVHYLVLAALFAFHVRLTATMMAAIVLTTFDFAALISLYVYMKWNR